MQIPQWTYQASSNLIVCISNYYTTTVIFRETYRCRQVSSQFQQDRLQMWSCHTHISLHSYLVSVPLHSWSPVHNSKGLWTNRLRKIYLICITADTLPCAVVTDSSIETVISMQMSRINLQITVCKTKHLPAWS